MGPVGHKIAFLTNTESALGFFEPSWAEFRDNDRGVPGIACPHTETLTLLSGARKDSGQPGDAV